MDFLGKKAKFPYGPFLIASKFSAPVTFVYAVKEKKFHYALSATKPIIDKLQPEEIAKLISFLVSDEASYITGQCIGIDGGLSIGALGG